MNDPSGIDIAPSRNAAVLSVSPTLEDRASLERILRGSGWTLLVADAVASSFSILRERTVSIVICEDSGLPGTWRELLTHIALLDDPPLLIVTARLADERLWAEALNLGAYDVLATPFDVTEVTRIVEMAHQHWDHRRELLAGGSQPRPAANKTSQPCGEKVNESNCIA
jgi:DNA-binding response OmpR family regulator